MVEHLSFPKSLCIQYSSVWCQKAIACSLALLNSETVALLQRLYAHDLMKGIILYFVFSRVFSFCQNDR